jgi:hypothetical protein
MPIETHFAFRHAHPQEPRAEGFETVDLLGPLRGLVGNAPVATARRTWKGTGFNLIWRPNFGSEFGSKDFFLELNLTDETLSFTDISGTTGVANRGLLQRGIFLGSVAYLQTINDRADGTGQHFEPGVWANVPATMNPNERQTVVRMGSIPHGTTINLQGEPRVVGQPNIQPATITPFRIGSPDDGVTKVVHFPEETLAVHSTSRTNLTRVTGLTQGHLANPNLFLIDALAGQSIAKTTVLAVSSDSSAPQSVPDSGGGTANIAFLAGTRVSLTGGPNADAPIVTSTFWIEEGTDAAGEPLLQLQYTQRVLLNFNGLSWPHVTVATLRPLITGS